MLNRLIDFILNFNSNFNTKYRNHKYKWLILYSKNMMIILSILLASILSAALGLYIIIFINFILGSILEILKNFINISATVFYSSFFLFILVSIISFIGAKETITPYKD